MLSKALFASALTIIVSAYAYADDLDEAIFKAMSQAEVSCKAEPTPGSGNLNSCFVKAVGPMVCVQRMMNGFTPVYYTHCLLSNFVPDSRDQKDICYDRIWNSLRDVESKNGVKTIASKSGSFSIAKKSDESFEIRVVVNGRVVSDRTGQGCNAIRLCENMQVAVSGDDTFTNPENPDNPKLDSDGRAAYRARLAEAVRKSTGVCPPVRATGWDENGEGKVRSRNVQ